MSREGGATLRRTTIMVSKEKEEHQREEEHEFCQVVRTMLEGGKMQAK